MFGKCNCSLTYLSAWKDSLSNADWNQLIKKSELTKCLTLDHVAETGYAVMSNMNDDDQCDVLYSLRSLAPLSMSEGAKLRLTYSILYELGKKCFCYDTI